MAFYMVYSLKGNYDNSKVSMGGFYLCIFGVYSKVILDEEKEEWKYPRNFLKNAIICTVLYYTYYKTWIMHIVALV